MVTPETHDYTCALLLIIIWEGSPPAVPGLHATLAIMWAVAIMGGCTHHPSPSAGVGERVAPPLRGVGGMGTPPGTRGVGTPLPGTGPEPGFSDEDCILVYDHKHKTGGGGSPRPQGGVGRRGGGPGQRGVGTPLPSFVRTGQPVPLPSEIPGEAQVRRLPDKGGSLPLPQRGWGVPPPIPGGVGGRGCLSGKGWGWGGVPIAGKVSG